MKNPALGGVFLGKKCFQHSFSLRFLLLGLFFGPIPSKRRPAAQPLPAAAAGRGYRWRGCCSAAHAKPNAVEPNILKPYAVQPGIGHLDLERRPGTVASNRYAVDLQHVDIKMARNRERKLVGLGLDRRDFRIQEVVNG